jgi:polysaccharide deacetylase family protein (PEP-CTERM system associated)
MVSNVLSVDVEEYFHPTELLHSVSCDDWERLPSRVECQTMQVLEMLDRRNVRATFFVLGWVADRKPRLVRAIREAGHEIGSHSYSHHLVYELTPRQFHEDTRRSVRAIEDACGISPRVYRAPSYSMTARSLWALEVLTQCGFTHDSSIYPISHDRYGFRGFGRHVQTVQTTSGPIIEIPIATARAFRGRLAPVGGGAYLRLFPYCYTAAGLRRINIDDQTPACVYFHPWELDPEQPRLARGALSRIRTYKGLGTMARKLDRLLVEFRFSTLTDVYPASAGVFARA